MSTPNVTNTQIIAGIKVIETEYEVKVPKFHDITINRPIFVDQEIKVPVGFDKVIQTLAEDIADKITLKVLDKVNEKLAQAIDARISEIKYPKLIEEIKITEIPITVEKPVYKDVEVSRPIYTDKTVLNAVMKDVEVTNAVVVDKLVLNCIIQDINVTNAIIKDVEIERPVIKERVVEVIHKHCFDPKGNPLE